MGQITPGCPNIWQLTLSLIYQCLIQKQFFLLFVYQEGAWLFQWEILYMAYLLHVFWHLPSHAHLHWLWIIIKKNKKKQQNISTFFYSSCSWARPLNLSVQPIHSDPMKKKKKNFWQRLTDLVQCLKNNINKSVFNTCGGHVKILQMDFLGVTVSLFFFCVFYNHK